MSQTNDVPLPVVEIIPSQSGEISAIASAHAPILYFDTAPSFGCHAGIVNITLEMMRYMSVGTAPTTDRVVVAHLRMSIPAAQALKAAIDGALLLGMPAAGGQDSGSPNQS